jgi:hypothetical protein
VRDICDSGKAEWRTLKVELSDAQIDAAAARGLVARQQDPRTAAARYNCSLDRLIVELANGCSFTFSPHLAQELEAATAQQLAQIEILGVGTGLHWKALDVDLSTAGLLAGLFGTRAHMARQAGRATSPAKAAAARTNGARGGRPRNAGHG